MVLRDKIREIETTLIGNRAAAIGTALLAGGVGSLAINFPGNEISSNGQITAITMATGFATAAGIVLTSITGFGLGIDGVYKRTGEHLKKFKKIDPRFFDRLIGMDKYNSLAGYCQLQGMYLACRDYVPEFLPEFYKMKKERTKNILPNF